MPLGENNQVLLGGLDAKDTNDAKAMAETIMTTGYVAAYRVLIEETKGATFLSECKRLGLHSDYVQATALVDKAVAAGNMPKGIDPDSLRAISMYTFDKFYAKLNQGWREKNSTIVLDYAFIMSAFIKGFRYLPSEQVEIYRGITVNPTGYAAGQCICFEQVTSASASKEMALTFLQMRKPDEAKREQRVMFIIRANTGRRIDPISFYPTEREYVLRPYTHFQILSVVNEKDGVCYVTIRQLMEDVRGLYVLLWVDDTPLNNKAIIAACERKRVTVVWLTSTADFILCYKLLEKTMQRDMKGFRVCSDMARMEDGKMIIDAGLTFCNKLRSMGYQHPMMIFTGSTHVQANQKRVKASGIQGVTVTDKTLAASRFCSFEDDWETAVK
jgi:hypothetical protein